VGFSLPRSAGFRLNGSCSIGSDTKGPPGAFLRRDGRHNNPIHPPTSTYSYTYRHRHIDTRPHQSKSKCEHQRDYSSRKYRPLASGVAPRACVRVYVRVLVPPNLCLCIHTCMNTTRPGPGSDTDRRTTRCVPFCRDRCFDLLLGTRPR